MPLGIPAKINQIRLSLARKTPELEKLYTDLLNIEKAIPENQEELNRAELKIANRPNLFPNTQGCLASSNGTCGSWPLWSGVGIGIVNDTFNVESLRRLLETLREEAATTQTNLDTQVTSQAKTDPKGQLTFQLSADTAKLERFDLAPGEYFDGRTFNPYCSNTPHSLPAPTCRILTPRSA
ncbi:MAG: hypothetical protein NTY08_17170 [Proteobacteria bacterium]|nr:hypothetical protein [Pseudomonadota bacterium]